MIDYSRVHSDFKDQYAGTFSNRKILNTFENDEKRDSFQVSKSLDEYEWLNNKFCPCCGIHHDMVLIHHQNIVKNIVEKHKQIIHNLYEEVNSGRIDHFNSESEDYIRKENEFSKKLNISNDIISRYENKNEPSRIYCPYYSKTITGWTEHLYSILCDDYTKVNHYSNSEYNIKLNLIKPMLEKNKQLVEYKEICLDKYVELTKAAEQLQQEMESVKSIIPELKEYAKFLKENKDKTSKIIRSAKAQQSGSPGINTDHFDASYWDKVISLLPGN
jgi:hypothetical protein